MSVLRNQGNSDAEISITLYGDDEFLDSQWVTVPANGTKTVCGQNTHDCKNNACKY